MHAVARLHGYLPLEDYGLIGDGSTAALVGRDGGVDWLCLPRFDSPPLFCSLLDARNGGSFVVRPDDLVGASQRYDGDGAVLVTEMRSSSGVLRLTDALALRAGADLSEDAAWRGELVRLCEVLDGHVRATVEVRPRGGASTEPFAGGVRLRCAARPDVELHLSSTVALQGASTVLDLSGGERFALVLRWGGGAQRSEEPRPDQLLGQTRAAWQRWLSALSYDGPWREHVRRSAVTLKLLDHFPNGAIVAAPTSSLPERIGGVRNWDYRYSWIRDAAFSVYALRRIGLQREARSFLGWVLDAIERHGDERPCVLYDLDGEHAPPEEEDPELEGYRGSAPVRWGNAAAGQRQHDVYGEVVDCAFQWARGGETIDDLLWRVLVPLVDAAAREWREPDHGIWEVRTPGHPYTYSAALCHVALDRGAWIAERFGLPADVRGWRRSAETIRQAILEDAWSEDLQAITEHLGRGALDASLLALPLRRVVDAGHPRMVATTKAIQERLGAGGGLLYRYLPHESPDGLLGDEGAFLLCSFWLVDNLAGQGRVDQARELLDALCARASPLGLLPEQIDPATGAFLGNFPQAFSHVGLIASAVNLARLERQPTSS